MGDKKQPQPAPPTPAPKEQKDQDKAAAPPQPAPAPQPGTEKKEAPKGAAPPVSGDQGKDLSETPVASKDKPPDKKASDTPTAAGPSGLVTPFRPLLTTVPTDPIDWFAMRKPFLDRGVPLTGRDADQIKLNWTFSYTQMVGWGLSPDLAIKIANIGTPLAYDFAMARDNPTQIEKFDMETEKMLPPGQKLGKIVVPVITPDTLGFVVEKISGKKIDFRF